MGGLFSANDTPLEERYAQIKGAGAAQQANYEAFLAGLSDDDKARFVDGAAALGIAVDLESGHISYAKDFEAKRLRLNFNLLYCRHGKTTGNTEPRVYQGFVDEPENALNEVGLGQAEAAADKLDALGVSPDLIVLSPLSRAADTGEAWIRRHEELRPKVEAWPESAEMHFGAWDNVKVKDLEDENICHLFYLQQNAVVKSFEDYTLPSTGEKIPGENFVETILRMHGVLQKLQDRFPAGAADRPLVIMYGHSMAGAAISVLCGKGKNVDGEAFLGFDGKYIMPNATPTWLYTEEG